MHFRKINLYKKATHQNYYTPNSSLSNCNVKASTAYALASLSVGAAAGTIVLKNVQKKCALDLEEQLLFGHHKEELMPANSDKSNKDESNQQLKMKRSLSGSMQRKRRSKFRNSSFATKGRRMSFDGFSSNILKVDKNIRVNGTAATYGFNIDGLNNNHYNYTQKSSKNEQKEHTKEHANFDYTGQTHLSYASLHHVLANENSIGKLLVSTADDENTNITTKNESIKENRIVDFKQKKDIMNVLSNQLDNLNIAPMEKSSIPTVSDTAMLKSISMQAQKSYAINEQKPTDEQDLLKHIKVVENLKLDDWLNDKNIVVTEEYYEKTKQIWPTDTDKCLNKIKFTNTLTEQIHKAYEGNDLNKIYSLYLAMKRNDCTPSVETFDLIIKSLCFRDMDNNDLDERMFHILTCYQDLISMKIKPLVSTYHHIILALLNGSIAAIEVNNANGKDFFNIALDFFKTTYDKVLKNNISEDLVETLLYSSLKYQSPETSKYLYEILPSLALSLSHKFNDPVYKYLKIRFSYDLSTLSESIQSCIQDNAALNQGYCLIDNNVDIKDSITLTSAVVTGLIRMNNIKMASDVLNDTLVYMKQNMSHVDIREKQILIESYLLQLGQVDLVKSEKLRKVFEAKAMEGNTPSIPTLSVSYYKNLLYTVMCWLPHQNNIPIDLSALSKSIYTQRLLRFNKKNVTSESYSITSDKESSWKKIVDASNNIQPNRLSYEKLMNEFMNYHFHQVQNTRDLEILVMIIEDSIVNNYKFSQEMYFKILEFLINEVHASKEYVLRFVQSHGLMNMENLQFLNTSVSAFEDNNMQEMILRLSKTKYFVSLMQKFKLENMDEFEYKGIRRVFESIWMSKQDLSMIGVDLSLHSYVLEEFLNTEYMQSFNSLTSNTMEFFENLKKNFLQRFETFSLLNLDINKVEPQVVSVASVLRE